MSLIQAQGLTFAYEGSYENVFENSSFSVDTEWRLGLVGRNGRGKTTLLRLLMGLHTYAGSITPAISYSYFPYDAVDEEAMTLEIISAIAPESADWEVRRELSLLDVEEEVLYRPFGTLSQGEKTKAQLVALFLRRDEMLLIDEPTNHLDAMARLKLAEYLKAKKGFILVSHDRRFLDGCVDHIMAINKTGMQVVHGNFSAWQRSKEMRDAFEIEENERRSSEIKRLSMAAQRNANWSDKLESTKIGTHAADRGAVGHKAAKMMKRAKSIETRRQAEISEKEKLLHDIEYNSPLIVRPKRHGAARLVEARELSVAYGEREIFRDFSFCLEQGNIIALCGKNGSGKSSVLKLVMGENVPHTGELSRASGLVISYVPQDTSFLKGDLTRFAQEAGIDESLIKTILRKLDFRRIQFEKDMREFSMGQRKKVLIAKSLCEQAHLYIWDEPLNYVDVLSRIQIEELIIKYAPTMLLVEHDSAFLDAVGAKRVELCPPE